MCYNLMKEEILIRLRELKADLIERYSNFTIKEFHLTFKMPMSLKLARRKRTYASLKLKGAHEDLIHNSLEMDRRRSMDTLYIFPVGDWCMRRRRRLDSKIPSRKYQSLHFTIL